METWIEQGREMLASPVGLRTWIVLAVVLAAALLAGWITRRLLPRLLRPLVEATSTRWDDALLGGGVLRRLSHVVPVLVLYTGIGAVPDLHDGVVALLRKLLPVLVVLFLAGALSRFLSAINTVYEGFDFAYRRPIKGYVQLGKLAVYLVALILVVSMVIERSPLLLLSGLGALGAVVLLVFKDTILSLVASVQIATNDMLRIGDWIEMPSLGADGDVIDIALHTVKVQNFDKTIVTIPTYRLIDDSFTNWRGMTDSGGRRIKRALLLDQRSVGFVGQADRERLARIALLREHLARKRDELAEWNAALGDAAGDAVNTRRLTNLGLFRAYAAAYLAAHPRIDGDKTLMVRQLEPGAGGLPLELYCFADTVSWSEYEGIQADIIDHLLAVLPEFGLRVYQQPGGGDLADGLRALGEAAANAPRRDTGEAPVSPARAETA